MNGENTGKSKKGFAIKIIIPILILCIVAGIWVIKNWKVEIDSASAESTDIVNSTATDNTDFELLVTEKLDMDKLKSYGIPIIIDFGSDSCIPCKEMAPVLEELNAELKGKAIIRFVDVWKYPELADGYPISVIPTQVFFDAEGKPYSPSDTETLQLKQYSLQTTGEHVFTAHEGGLTKEQFLSALKEMGLE